MSLKLLQIKLAKVCLVRNNNSPSSNLSVDYEHLPQWICSIDCQFCSLHVALILSVVLLIFSLKFILRFEFPIIAKSPNDRVDVCETFVFVEQRVIPSVFFYVRAKFIFLANEES